MEARSILHDDLLTAELTQELPAGAAGEARRSVRAVDRDQLDVTVLGVGEGHGRRGVSLGADGEAVRGVLDVGPGVYIPSRGQNCRADVEVAVRCVGALRGRPGGL